jgi:hypothetical protein
MPRWQRISILSICAAIVGITSFQLFAEEGSPDSGLDALIQRLDADRFADRQAAADELARLGSDAFPSLEAAARSESREVSQRAIEILKKHFQADDTATKNAAKASLERLASDISTRAGRLADEVLNPPPSQIALGLMPVRRPLVRVAAAKVRMNVVQPAGAKRIHVRNTNGVKQTEVEENGRKVELVEDPANGIKLQVTEKKDGKETTQKYAGKDVDDLKKNHPDAGKILDDVRKAADSMQARIAVGQRLANPAGNPGNARDLQLQSVQRSLEALDRQIQNLRNEAANNPALLPHIENLERTRDRLSEIKARIAR